MFAWCFCATMYCVAMCRWQCFWNLLSRFVHTDTLSQLNALSQIKTDIGRSRVRFISRRFMYLSSIFVFVILILFVKIIVNITPVRDIYLTSRSVKLTRAVMEPAKLRNPQSASYGWCQRAQCSENTQSTRRQEFLSRGSKSLEQSACSAVTAVRRIRTVQATFKVISFLARSRRICDFFVFSAPFISWIYLLTYGCRCGFVYGQNYQLS